MRRIVKGFAGTTCASLLQLAIATGANADAVYHTAQVPLSPVTNAPGSGTVINIHANGPTVYAHELYVLKKAVPGTYTVTLHIFPTSQNCSGGEVTVPSATFATNAQGNGVGSHTFTPADAASLRGLTLSAFWTVDGPADYTTQCSVITLD